MRCEFDPAAVSRNMQRNHAVEWEGKENKEDINLGTVVPIAVISILIILSLLIAVIVLNHKRKSSTIRERKLSRLNGVKVLPDVVIQREVDDSMVSDICILFQALFSNSCTFFL